MKSRILSAVISICILKTFTGSKNLNHGYIQLIYLADISKPYPILIFYLPGTSDSAYKNFYHYRFEITEEAFKEIKKTIENTKVSKDSILEHSYEYQFTIVINDETSVFFAPYFSRIRQVFQTIATQIKDPTIQNRVRLQLDDIIFRLKGDIKLN
jgi:hypothetical protein